MNPTKPVAADSSSPDLPAPFEIAALITEDLYSGNPDNLACRKCGNTRTCADPECPLTRELAKNPRQALKRQYGLYYKTSRTFELVDLPIEDLLRKFGEDGKSDEVTLFVEYSRSQPEGGK
jgi:hypothetical protein